ncbi:uncharacterized protein LOC144433121 [Glandiceps talaboti]
MYVTKERLENTLTELHTWQGKRTASKRQLQSIIGKLMFIAACVRPGRLFVSRMLKLLKKLKRNHHKTRLTGGFKKDIMWWLEYLPLYNGISMIPAVDWSAPGSIFHSDACLSGCGGITNRQYFHSSFPEHIIDQRLHISALEMLTVVVAFKLWGIEWKGQRVTVMCDNEATVSVINTGRSKDNFMIACNRELLFWCASFQVEVRAKHTPGRDNTAADYLTTAHAFAVPSGGQLVPLDAHVFTGALSKLIRLVGLPPRSYSGHSFRRGGCSFAFHCSVPPEMLRLHGDWASDAFRRYLRVPLSDKLLVTARMGQAIRQGDF